MPTHKPLNKVSPCYSLSLPNRPLEYFSQSRGSKIQDGALMRALVPRCSVQGSVQQGLVSFSSFRGLGGVHVHSSLCFANQIDTKSNETWLLSVSLCTAACRRQLHPNCLQPIFSPLPSGCVLFLSIGYASLLLHQGKLLATSAGQSLSFSSYSSFSGVGGTEDKSMRAEH